MCFDILTEFVDSKDGWCIAPFLLKAVFRNKKTYLSLFLCGVSTNETSLYSSHNL